MGVRRYDRNSLPNRPLTGHLAGHSLPCLSDHPLVAHLPAQLPSALLLGLSEWICLGMWGLRHVLVGGVVSMWWPVGGHVSSVTVSMTCCWRQCCQRGEVASVQWVRESVDLLPRMLRPRIRTCLCPRL